MSGTPGRAVLVADDDPGIRRFIKDCLKSRGLTITEASDGISASEQAESSPPSLVLLDVVLPKRDGYAVLLHLRSTEATRNIPVILMSGEWESEQIAMSLGAHAFLGKPFTAAHLQSTVDSILAPEKA